MNVTRKTDYDSYRGTTYCVLQFESREKVNKHSWATTEASEASCPPRSAAACGRFILPAPARRLPLEVSWVGWRSPTAPRGKQWQGLSDRTSERNRDVVVGRVNLEVHTDEKLGCGGLFFFRGVAGDLGCAKGLKRSRAAAFGGPTSRNGDFSALNQPTILHQFASRASVTWSNAASRYTNAPN